MMMCFTAMEKSLSATGLYTITEGTRLYAELKAYDAGLQILRDRLEDLKQESFISTADTYGLSKKEALFCLENSACTLEERKEMLLLRGSIHVNCINADALKKAMLSSGVEVEITESTSTQSIAFRVVNVKGNQTEANITSAITSFLPAHLDCTITFAN